jgi:hypothetical protein
MEPDARRLCEASLNGAVVVVPDIAAMHNMINSLRPQSKTDETQHEIMCCVLNECPVMNGPDLMAPVTLGKDVYVHNYGSENRMVVKDMLTEPVTGLLFLAVSRDRCRLSIALMEAEVQNVPSGFCEQFSFSPAPLLHVLKAYTKCPVCTIHLTESSMTFHFQRKSNNPAQVTFPFVMLDNKEDGRLFFTKVTESVAFRMEGTEFADKLRVLDTTAASITLQHVVQNTTKNTFLTLGTTEGNFKLMDTYAVRSPVASKCLDLRIEDVTTTIANIGDMQALLPDWEAQYHRTFPEALQKGVVEKLAVGTDGTVYQLVDRSLFDSKMLTGIINDHIKNLNDGLTLMMGRQGPASFIILTLPLHGRNVVFHVVACKVAEDELIGAERERMPSLRDHK